MLMYGPARPKSPPQGKEGRNKVADRPTLLRIALCDRQSQAGECAEEMSAVDCLGPFCSCHNILLLLLLHRLATHSSRHTAAADLIDVLALPKPRSSVLELCIVQQ